MVDLDENMNKKLFFIFLFLFLSFSLYSQTGNLTIIAEKVFKNYQKDEIIEKDIQEIMSNENAQYIEKVFVRGKWSEDEIDELGFIEEMFLSNFSNHYSNVEQNVLYRLVYEKDNTFHIVYGTVSAPRSFISSIRMFIRTDEYYNPDIQINRPDDYSGFFYSQPISITVIAEDVLGNIQKDKIIEKDIQEMAKKENAQYIEKVIDLRTAPIEDRNERGSIDNLFRSNYSDIEENVLYRIIYERNNTLYIAYGLITTSTPFWISIRLFFRTDNNSGVNINRSDNNDGQSQFIGSLTNIENTTAAITDKKPGFFTRLWNTIKKIFSLIFLRKG
jgi:hypothetical protein